MRIEKSLDANYKVGYRFIVSINTKDNESFCVKTFIKSKEHLNTLIQQTIDALKQYPQFSKYIDDLENCLI